MKSRNFLITRSTETEASATKGFLLASTDAPQDVAASAVRRFELQHNQSPRFARRRQERRQGQALLLAVLIMLLAALLSAGFLAVVSGNLNQSARVADKTRAIEASRAGIAYANAQLSGSSQGDLWRPIDVSPAPNTTDAAYNFYYSQLDRVQGWAAKPKPQLNDTYPNATYNVPNYFEAQKVYRSITYGKFPDPNQVASDAPKFLVKVREVPANPADPDYEADHVGEIKITSIGLSEDDPNVFHRLVAYKSGRQKSPWASALRSVSNWNFNYKNGQGGIPFGGVTTTVATNASPIAPAVNVDVPVQTRVDNEDTPKFSKADVPFNVVIVEKDANDPLNSNVRGAVVIDVTDPVAPSTVATLKLARLEGQVKVGDVIQKAAAIGTAFNVDLLNVGERPANAPADLLNFPTQPQPNGILTNGSMWLQGQIELSGLRKTGTRLISSGSVAIDRNAADRKQVIESGDVGPTNNQDPNSNKLVPSSNVNFPGNIILSAAAASDGVTKADLIDDGWNKIGSVKTLGLDYLPNQKRTVEPFKPAKIDSPSNLARYRALTRNSSSGIYIDNRTDVEKVGQADMTQAQLLDMLMSPKPPAPPAPPVTPASYTRNGAAPTAGTGSLEENHLRGWVGPDEFRARGALIELFRLPGGPPKIRVTYDSRSDAQPAGADPAKALRDVNGVLQRGVYTRELDWPSNGTLFAEGNIRIRGDINLPAAPTDGTPDLFPSLTVVSLGNIYIEGPLSVGSLTTVENRKKLMLLAKKNVIVNPTRAVLGRTDVQTVATNTQIQSVNGAPNDPIIFTLPVANPSLFTVGDYIEIDGQVDALNPAPKVIRGLVKVVSAETANPKTLQIQTIDSGAVPSLVNAIVRSPLEKRDIDDTGTTPNRNAFSLVDTESAVNRRVLMPLANQNLNKLLFDHVGDLKKVKPAPMAAPGAPRATIGLKIKAVDYSATPSVPLPTTGFTAELTDKQKVLASNNNTDTVDASALTVEQAEKKVRVYNNFLGGQRDEFNQPPVDKTLTAFAADISASMGVTDNDMDDPRGYKYQGILNENTPAGGESSIGVLPYYSLAGVGLRYDPAPAAVMGFANNGRKAFAVDTTPPVTTPVTPADAAPNISAVIPLATSVEFDLNSTLSSLITPTAANATPVNYLGFNPVFGAAEDPLTVDSSFYQTKDKVIFSTIDQRVLSLVNPTTFITPQSIVLKRSNQFTQREKSLLLPDYRIRALKLENFNLSQRDVRPVAGGTLGVMNINAFIYAQEGSWLVIPGDNFRSTPAVRAFVDNSGLVNGSYIDYNDNKKPDAGEFITPTNGNRYADLNRNGVSDPGEPEAALRLTRYNYFQINFLGAIVENQTAVVSDVPGAAATDPPVVRGAVQDWMDKWVSYTDSNAQSRGKKDQFKFMTYTYDPTLFSGSPGANQLRVPVTDDLLYQQ